MLATAVVVLSGVASACMTRSWAPLQFFAGLVLLPYVIVAVVTALSTTDPRRRHSAALGLAYAVVAAAAMFMLAGMASLLERVIWFNAPRPPAVLLAREYGHHYGANAHRMFKATCEAKTGHASFDVMQVGGVAYLRCGDWFPQVFSVSADSNAFDEAVAATGGDPPGRYFLVEPPHGS